MFTGSITQDLALSGVGVGCYLAAGIVQAEGVRARRDLSRPAGGLLLAGILLFAWVVVERWLRVGHGPFVTLFEMILSNLFSLGLIYGIAYWRFPIVRCGAPVAVFVLFILGVWLLNVPNHETPLPASFRNPWLWAHVAAGKLFLGSCLVSMSVAATLLSRRISFARPWLGETDAEVLDAAAWRALSVAFLFHSLMLIAGAIWAQDAWGRFWDWDPLETWSFLTWLAMAIALHARVTFTLPAWVGPCAMVAIFGLAFLTFFGLPFLSTAAHKGAI